MPSVDIIEDDKESLVKAELPEVKREEIKVQVRDQTLSITEKRKAKKEEKGKRCHGIEHTYGSFERSFTHFGRGQITSNFKEGVLRVKLPSRAQDDGSAGGQSSDLCPAEMREGAGGHP